MTIRSAEILVTPASCRLSRGHLALAGGGETPPRQPPGRRRYLSPVHPPAKYEDGDGAKRCQLSSLIAGLSWARLRLGQGVDDGQTHSVGNDSHSGARCPPGSCFWPGSGGICLVEFGIGGGDGQGRIGVGFGIEPWQQAARRAPSATGGAAGARKDIARDSSASFDESASRHCGARG